jgi:seryl-tRNA synthetase
MLDIRTIRENPELVKAAGQKKRIPVDAEVDRILDLDAERRKLTFEKNESEALQNRVSKEIPSLKGDEKAARILQMREVGARIKDLKARIEQIEQDLDGLLLRVPNLPDPEVPEGENEAQNVVLRTWGEPPRFEFPFKDHLTLGEELDLIDIGRSTRMAGSRTYILKNDAALLELAVLQYALSLLVERGFVPMVVPTLVRREPLVGTAYFPGGEEQAYACERDGLFLVGTSEVPVTSYHAGEVLEESELPKLYAGYSSCFRREAGAAGKDTKGLYRIHQFNKVEQVVVCRNDEAESKRFHQFILKNSEDILQALRLPYRVVNVCGGDLGLPQVQKYDIETWMPSRGGYGETHSASRFYDFQARRLNLRYRDAGGRMQFCHTLNNTAIASPRILISILEIYQEADGRVRIPDVLRPYLGGRTHVDRQGGRRC